MSRLHELRKAIRTALTAELWAPEAVIIKRRTKIWNEVATVIGASKRGAVIVIGVAKGDPDASRPAMSKTIPMTLTIPVTLIELPRPDPTEADEDLLWERTVELLQANQLGRTERHTDFIFDGFDDIEDERYVIRQTLFKTRIVLGSTT